MRDDTLQVDEGTEDQELCIRCLAPNVPGSDFCRGCGCQLTPFAATAPFVSVFAEGDLYQHAVDRPDRPIVLLGMWVIFGALGLVGLLFVFEGDLATRLSGIVMLSFSGLILTKTTRRYRLLRAGRVATKAVEPTGSATIRR